MNNSPLKRNILEKIFQGFRIAFSNEGALLNTTVWQRQDEEGTEAWSIQNGYSYADNNPDWRSVDRKDTIQKMLLDEKINQVWNAYKKPLSAAHFYIQPATDDEWNSDDVDVQNGMDLEKILFEWMDRSWRSFVKDAVTSLDWGHAVFEKIYYYDGMWKLKRLAFRPQKTIEKWEMDKEIDGSKRGVLQRLSVVDSGEPNDYNIPENKLLIFTNDKIGDNPEGTSILRPVYRAWKIKYMVWNYQVRILEKFSGGIMQVWVPENTQDNEIKKLEILLENITASKQSGIVHPGPKEKGWNAEFMDLKIGDTKILETIDKLDNSISSSLLNSFLDSNNGQAGSYARSESLKDFFNQALNAWLAYFCEEFNNNVVKELAYFNGWKNLPKLCFTPVKNAVEIDKFANAVSTLANTDGLTLWENDEDAIRQIVGLPDRVYDEESEDGAWDEEKQGQDEDWDKKKADDKPEDKKQEGDGNADEGDGKVEMKKDGNYTWCVMLNLYGMTPLFIDPNDLAEQPYDGPLHVTLLYGLNNTIDQEKIAEKIKYEDRDIKIIWMKVFEKDDADVLVLEVEKEDWLMSINEELKKLDYKNDYPEYTPHITLGYLKKWTVTKYLSDVYDGEVARGSKIVYTSDENAEQVALFKKDVGCSCGAEHKGWEDCRSFQRKIIDAQMAKHFEMPDFRQLVANKKSFTWARDLTVYEKNANLWGLDDYTNEVKKFLDEKMTDITEKQKAYMLAIVQKAVSQNDISILENANIPHENELIELLTEVTKESFEAGKITASQEIGSEVPKTSKDVRGVIRAEQVGIVAGFLGAMKMNTISSVAQVLKKKGNDISETSTSEAVNNARVSLDAYLTKQKSGYNTSSVMGSINAGRSSVYEENASDVLYAQYSAVLDGVTTARCASLDGKIVRYGSAEYYNYSPPGHWNCRSLWIGIRGDEKGVEKINLNHIPASIPPTWPLNNFRDTWGDE